MSVDGSPEQPASTAPTKSSLTGDWPIQAADTVVDLVGTVRDRTVEPLLKLARIVVYGLLITIVTMTAAVLVMILGIRVLDVYLPGEVWSAYLVLGSVFTLGGFVCWSRRTPRSS